ncbi:MAG: class I SAM-dependent methyltransferase [Candidatus Omnitrophica bacterium]|nr:class I SAM-dependent methyltransferase [Candidatus Omnitrophota bacterium]
MMNRVYNLIKKIFVTIYAIPRIFNLHVLPGHFYSPIPSLDEARKAEKKIWPENMPKVLPGIDLNVDEQVALFNEFVPFYRDLPFKSFKSNELRFYFENPAYQYSDAIFLYCMMRKLRPKNIIEIGSGFSSCAIMDTNEVFLGNETKVTFIEPFPSLLISLMKDSDKKQYRILPKRLEDCELSEFAILQENDILFIDSTHVAKVNSDVNQLFFNILPLLNKGVYIHFHDIFYPFEYPKELIYGGCAWNEGYILRAFLQYNNSFKIVFFNTFLEHFFKEMFEAEMPLCLKNPGGSIWIKKCGT